MNHTHNLNNDIMNALAETYKNMVAESHTHEELKKLSVEKLKELKAEYTKKAGSAEGEEKEKHEKELANIESILASREEDRGEDKEEMKESAAEDTQKKAWALHQKATDPEKKKVYGDLAAQAARRSTNPTGVKIGVRGTEAGAGNRAQRRMGKTPKQAALPEWMQRRMDKHNTAADAEPVEEAARVTPARQSVIDRALNSINPHKRDQAKMLDKLTIPAEMRGNGSDDDLKSELGRIQQMKRGKFKLGEEIQQVDEIFDSPAGQKAARSYILKAQADKKKVGDEADAVEDEIHSRVEAEAGHPDSGMGREAIRANFQFMPGGEKLVQDQKRLDKKYKGRATGIERAMSKLRPMEESENKDCGCNHVQESMEKINALKERAAKMREIGKNK
jgi:hypothetical protein